MCSFAVQIVYGIIGTIVLGTAITSLVMDSWTKISESDHRGLFCSEDKIKEAIEQKKSFSDVCGLDFENFSNIDPASQAIIIAIVLAIVAEIFCLTYNFFTACACCCKTILLPVLIALSVVTTILLGIAVGVYIDANPDRIEELKKFEEEAQQTGFNKDLLGMGNSFIFAACAFGGAVLNTIVAIVACCCAATLV